MFVVFIKAEEVKARGRIGVKLCKVATKHTGVGALSGKELVLDNVQHSHMMGGTDRGKVGRGKWAKSLQHAISSK